HAEDRMSLVRAARRIGVLVRRRGAHRAPGRTRQPLRRGLGRLPVLSRQSERAAPRAVVSRRGLPALVQCRARYRELPLPRCLQGGREGAGGGSVSQVNRLGEGGRIDRGRPLDFRFNGRRLTGFAGDTVASALIANGVHLVARSFKYHRPRGIVGAGAEEPNAVFQVDEGAHTVPNLRATQTELYDDLIAASVNCWPSVGFDVGAINGWFARLLPAGFYYKTFMW